MSWRGLVSVVAAASGAAACSALVGLGEPPVVPPEAGSHVENAPSDAGDARPVACGVDAGASACEACVASKCCAAATACATSSACAAYEGCLVPCGGDYACRSRCLVASYASASPIPAMDQCVASECPSECGINCGLTSTYSEPDAAVACQQCLTTNACDTAQACGTDLACQQILHCELGCATADCFFACPTRGDAGTTLSYIRGAAHCAAQCGAGGFWDCRASGLPPLTETGQTVLTLNLIDFIDGKPLAGATVKACARGDLPCATPVVPPGVTDASGNVTFTLVADGMVGFAGYFDISSPSIYPSLLFLEAPLSVPRVTFPAVLLPRASVIHDFYAQAGVTQDPSRGVVELQSTDCHWSPASGVEAQTVPAGAGARFAYFANGVLSLAASSTDVTGYSVLLDAPVGSLLTVSTTPLALGRATGSTTLFARAGTWSFMVVHPQ